MNYKKYLFFLFLCLFLNACSDDNKEPGGGGGGGDDDDRPETLAWIEDTMREKYLWNQEIPKAINLDYNTDPEKFFTSLLYKGDGKTKKGQRYYYSYIEKLSETRGSIQEENTYGFEYTSVLFSNKSNRDFYGFLVLYVFPETPAALAGLKRGDWIVGMNDKDIANDTDYEKLFDGTAKILTIAQWDSQIWGFINYKQVSINAATAIDNFSPIYKADIIPWGNKRVGYLLYDRFARGKDVEDISFDNELRSISGEWSNNIDEFVLDLRYNNGGYLTCVQLLCAILGPNSILNTSSIGYLEANDGSKEYFRAGKEELGTRGKNLNLQRLFVLVSSWSASASEAVIYLLRSLPMEVIVIGETTEGKNVGSVPFTSKDKIWKMQPITTTIFNSQGFSDYANGITPDVKIGDIFDYNNDGSLKYIHDDIYELGNGEERLLRAALEIIDGRSYRDFVTSRGNPTTTQNTFNNAPFNSLNRKATNGVIINIP